MSSKRGLLERLADGPVVGDGSMMWILEKRGYAKLGPWTPEAVVEYPDAVLQLHREYVRAGADAIQTATFNASDEMLSYKHKGREIFHTSTELNNAACQLAKKAAAGNDCLVYGSFSPSITFEKDGKKATRARFAKQLQIYLEHDVDYVIAEFFHDINEIEICASEMKKLGKPIVLCMRIGVMGDVNGISVEECALRMAKTGADVIGTNCSFDFNTSLKVMKRIKAALDSENLTPYLICQPAAFMCPEAEDHPIGFHALPEYPLCLGPRTLTTIEAHRFARAAWEIGVRYIAGCCGFEPYHIRAIAHELSPERRQNPPVQDMAQPFGGEFFKKSLVSTLADGIVSSREYWYNLKPGSGPPDCPTTSEPFSNAKMG